MKHPYWFGFSCALFTAGLWQQEMAYVQHYVWNQLEFYAPFGILIPWWFARDLILAVTVASFIIAVFSIEGIPHPWIKKERKVRTLKRATYYYYFLTCLRFFAILWSSMSKNHNLVTRLQHEIEHISEAEFGVVPDKDWSREVAEEIARNGLGRGARPYPAESAGLEALIRRRRKQHRS